MNLDQVLFIELIKILLDLIVIAKNNLSHENLSNQFKDHTIQRIYKVLFGEN